MTVDPPNGADTTTDEQRDHHERPRRAIYGGPDYESTNVAAAAYLAQEAFPSPAIPWEEEERRP